MRRLDANCWSALVSVIGLVPSGDFLLPEPMLTRIFYVAVGHCQATMSRNDATSYDTMLASFCLFDITHCSRVNALEWMSIISGQF